MKTVTIDVSRFIKEIDKALNFHAENRQPIHDPTDAVIVALVEVRAAIVASQTKPDE